jgi:hypothetical protein
MQQLKTIHVLLKAECIFECCLDAFRSSYFIPMAAVVLLLVSSVLRDGCMRSSTGCSRAAMAELARHLICDGCLVMVCCVYSKTRAYAIQWRDPCARPQVTMRRLV